MAAFASLALVGQALAAAPVLERVVMVSRHGVRAPTATLPALAAETGRTWPAFPVGPGEMTDHGARALAAMGGYLRATYVRQGALPPSGCPASGAVQVWADGADHRTRQSGDIMASALAPGCGVVSHHGPESRTDPLFDAADVCPVDPAAALRSVQAATQGGTEVLDPASTRAVEATRAILGPQACAASPAACLKGPSGLAEGKGGPKITGPLALAASVSENLLLEYGQGMPADQVAWGHGGAAVSATLPAHNRSFTLLRADPYVASHRGAVMLQTLLDLVAGRAPTSPAAPRLSGGARVTMIAGHDTNLANIAGVVGLHWALPDQPDITAPDTTLALEVWKDARGETVRAVIYSQSLEQLRSAAPLDAAHSAGVTPLAIGACDGATACPLSKFVARVRARLPAACLPSDQAGAGTPKG